MRRILLFFCALIQFSGAANIVWSQSSNEQITVHIVEHPEYSHYDEVGKAQGPFPEMISQLFTKATVELRMEISSWPRAYAAATNRQGTMIAGLDRTAGREDHFHWVLPLISRTQHLLVLQESRYAGLTLDEAINSDGLAGCLKNSAQCEFLRKIGFPDDRIWEITGADNEDLTLLMMRQRFNFWIYNLDLMAQFFEQNNIAPDVFTSLGMVNESTAYLAAAKGNVKPEIIDRLIVAASGEMAE